MSRIKAYIERLRDEGKIDFYGNWTSDNLDREYEEWKAEQKEKYQVKFKNK